jgi:hypothetical protein
MTSAFSCSAPTGSRKHFIPFPTARSATNPAMSAAFSVRPPKRRQSVKHPPPANLVGAGRRFAHRKIRGAVCVFGNVHFGKNPDDIPFALLYLIENAGSVRAAGTKHRPSAGRKDISPVGRPPRTAKASPRFGPWPKFGNSGEEVVSLKGLERFSPGAAAQPLSEAVVLPVISRGQDRPLGVLICGVNPTRPLDDELPYFL